MAAPVLSSTLIASVVVLPSPQVSEDSLDGCTFCCCASAELTPSPHSRRPSLFHGGHEFCLRSISLCSHIEEPCSETCCHSCVFPWYKLVVFGCCTRPDQIGIHAVFGLGMPANLERHLLWYYELSSIKLDTEHDKKV